MASPSLQANAALSLTVQSGQMYAESFPNSIDLIVLLCSACMFVLVCCLAYRFDTVRSVITEASSYPEPVAERVYSRYRVSVASESEFVSEVVSEVVSELRRVESELSRSRSKVIEGIE